MSNDSEGFIQSGELPTNRAPAILNRAYCKGWHDAIANVLEHLESQKSTWGTTGIIPEHLIKHIMGNVQALQVNPPPSPSEAVERDLANASAFAASETARAGKILSALEDCSLALSQARQDNEAMASRLFDLEKRCSESDKRRAHD